jgi:hypothetical protein
MIHLPDGIVDIRTFLPVGGKEGGDYHGRGAGHWIVDTIISNLAIVKGPRRSRA